MHSLIFELSLTPLQQGEWVTDFDLCEDHEIDYCRVLEEDERAAVISEHGRMWPWFDKVFERGDTSDTIILKSDFAEVKREWQRNIQKALDKMVAKNMADTYGVMQAIQNPFGDFTRFVLTDYSGTIWSVAGNELFEMLDNLSTGDTLYIGAVLDYHW